MEGYMQKRADMELGISQKLIELFSPFVLFLRRGKAIYFEPIDGSPGIHHHERPDDFLIDSINDGTWHTLQMNRMRDLPAFHRSRHLLHLLTKTFQERLLPYEPV